MFQPSQIVFVLLVGLSPLPVTVTTRIITFLGSGIPINLHLPQESWEGGQPKLLGFVCNKTKSFVLF